MIEKLDIQIDLSNIIIHTKTTSILFYTKCVSLLHLKLLKKLTIPLNKVILKK